MTQEPQPPVENEPYIPAQHEKFFVPRLVISEETLKDFFANPDKYLGKD